MYKSNSVAQGTIEYLVIIGIVVVIALVVVGLVLTQVDNSQQISSSGNQLGLKSQVIGVTESLVDPVDGNFVVQLLNNSGEFITVSNVSVGDTNVAFSEDLSQGGSKFFRVDTSAVCDEGKIISEDVIITYVTVDGLTKVERYPAKVMFDCTPYVINQANLANQCPSCESCEVCEVCDPPGIGFIEFNTPSYSDNGDGTITDSVNGLVWQASSCDNGAIVSWYDAMDYCGNNTAELPGTGWRVPNLAEVGLLFNRTSWEMYGSPFTNNTNFWSSTTVPGSTSDAYSLYSDSGYIYIDYKYSYISGVRCVRSES